MAESEKPISYICHWRDLRMWLIQIRYHTNSPITAEAVLKRMDEIELDAYRKKDKEDGVQRDKASGGEGQ